MSNLAGKMYYDPDTMLVFQIKENETKNYSGDLIIGEPCPYIDDAKTCVKRWSISQDYLKKCVLIEDTCVEAYDEKIYNLVNGHLRTYAMDSTNVDCNPNFTYLKTLSDRHYTEYNINKNYNPIKA